MRSTPLVFVCVSFLISSPVPLRAVVADAAPDARIAFQVSIAGQPASGLIALGRSVNAQGTLSPSHKEALDKGFATALVPFRPGTRIPFSVRVRLDGRAWTDVTADQRLHIEVSLAALTFDPTGALVATPAPGMPDIKAREIVTVHVYFFPDENDRRRFGYDEYYLQASAF